jgi:hypothetical protein
VFKNFFGKKNDGFYLQLEDEQASSKPQVKTQAPVPAKPDPVAIPAAPVAVATATTPVTQAPERVTEPAAKVEKKSVKTEKKAAKKAVDPKSVAAPAPAVISAPAAPAITNFATDYLISPSSSSSRRLPGANMSGFLELARQVKKPANFKTIAVERKSSAE